MSATAECRCAIVIPTYNTGPLLAETVRAVCATGHPVIVVNDGSSDGTAALLAGLAPALQNLDTLSHPRNLGKGAAVATAGAHAAARGFTHLFTFDADGQHPAAAVPDYIAAAAANPDALIAGYPVFDHKAPWERVLFRRLATFWTRLLGLNLSLRDAMFGMRVYPLAPLMRALRHGRAGRRYDIECLAAIRLMRDGRPVVNLATPVRYLDAGEGGVSHYHYLRDNLRLSLLYLRFIATLPLAVLRRLLPPRAY